MNISDIITKCYILALIIRDDGERLLLGDGFYEFKEQLQHFQPNIFQNDVIELQGTDGQLLAGQVRRGATQSFDGYIADSTISREATEEHRQRFLAFFRKKHHYKVVYVFPDGSAIKRERGYIVDAPSVPEMFQRFPEFHVGLNFEDVNYYEYEEGEDGEEIFAHVQNIAIAGYVEGGLIWDNYGAVSNDITWVDYALKTTTDGFAQITDGVLGAPLNLEQLFGNTTQQTYAGKNILNTNALQRTLPFSTTSRGVTFTLYEDGGIVINGKNDGTGNSTISIYTNATPFVSDGGSYSGDIHPDDGVYRNVNMMAYDGTHYRTYRQNWTSTLDAGNCTIYVQVSTGETTQFSNYKIYPMLESGTTVSPYEPYVGGIPSPNPDYPQTVNMVTGRQTVKIYGNNLFDRSSASENYILKWSDGQLSPEAKSITGDFMRVIEGQEFSSNYYAFIFFYDENMKYIGNLAPNGQTISKASGGNFRHFTVPSGYGIFYTRVEYRTGTNGNIDMTQQDIMLNYGSTLMTYEQSRTTNFEINLGKNLCGSGSYLNTNAIALNIKSGEVIPQTFTVSFISDTAVSGAGAILYLDGSTVGNLGSIDVDAGTKTSATFTIPYSIYKTITANNTIQLRVYKSGSNYDTSHTLGEPMIEAGGVATPYAAYKTPIELCKISTYRDRIYENDGEWFIHKETGMAIVSLGTTVYTLTGGNKGSTYIPANKIYTFNAGAFCEKSTQWWSGAYWDGCFHENAANFMFVGSSTDDSPALKAKYDGSKLNFILATPTDTKITDQELIQQLSTIKALVGETNNIWLIPSSGAQGELEVRYSRGFINQGAGYEWDAAQGGGPNVVSVDGIDRTGFVWEVAGPATNPTLTNITTNQTMTFEGDVATGQTLTVNTSDQTATIEGTNVFAQMEGDWMQLAPGNNVITYTATGATEPSKIKWNGVVG